MRHSMRPAIARLVPVAAALLGLAAPAAPSLAAGPAEKSLPAKTIFFLKVDDAAKARKAIKASQIGQLINDPAMGPLKDDIKAKLEGPVKKVKETLGVTLDELLTLPQGDITVALVGREAAKDRPPVVLLASADAGENAEKMNDVMVKATKEAENQGAKISTETFKDSRFTVVRENEDDKSPLIWTKVGNVFHIASDADALKEFLSNGSGRADSLASSEVYQGVLKGVGAESQVVVFADVQQALALAMAANPNGQADQLKAQLQVTGLDAFKGLGASLSFGQGEYDQVMKFFIYSPGPAQGVLKIFAMPPIDLKPPAWVPASALSYQAFSWDLDAAWKAVSDLAGQFGGGAILEQAQRGIDPNGNFDFQKDVFGPLGNRITAISELKKPITEKSQRALFGIALDDEKRFQATFNKLIDVAKATPKKRDFQGTTIYDFEVPNLPNAGGARMNIEGPISVAIAKGTLFIATEPTYLEQILRSGAASLADNADFQAVAKRAPAKTSLLSFDRTEEQARALYEMIKGEGFQKALDQAAANNGGPKIKNPIDPAKVPDFSVFAKYLGQGGSYGIMDEQGLTITSFVLRKAAP